MIRSSRCAHFRESGSHRLSVIGLRGIDAVGGIETAVRELYPHLVERGWDVTVYTRSRYEPRGTAHSFRVRRLPTIYSRHLEAILHTGLCTLDAIFRGTDLIHYHAVGNALWLWVPRLLRIPTVVTVHGLDWERGKWGYLATRALLGGGWLAARLAHQVIGVSERVASYFAERMDRKVHVIPNGVPTPQLPPDSEWLVSVGLEEPFLLFLGRLVPEKGVTTLLRAFRRTNLEVKLVIAGAGTHTDTFVTEVRELASQDERVVLVGPRHGREKTALFSRAAVFVLPSLIEGMPIALLEAMGHGVPCVVSDIPELLEVVGGTASKRAFVFRSGDVAHFATQLESAMSEAASTVGAAGQAHVRERYNWRAIAEATEAVYWQAIAE